MSEQLKPCPFCGGDSTFCETKEMDHDAKFYPAFYVTCDECGVRTATAFASSVPIEEWNSRKALTAAQQRVQQLQHDNHTAAMMIQRRDADNEQLKHDDQRTSQSVWW